MEKYKLLKDWPGNQFIRGAAIEPPIGPPLTTPRGTIITQSYLPASTDYYHGPERCFSEKLVKHNPEWFEEVEEPEFTESQMIEFGQWMYEHNSAYCHPKAAFNEWYNNQNNAKEER